MDQDILNGIGELDFEELQPSIFPIPSDMNIDDYLREILDEQMSPTQVEVDTDNGPYIGQWKEIENISKKNIPAINNSLARYFSDSSLYQKIRTIFPDEIEHKCWHQINTTDDPIPQESLTKAKAVKQSLLELVGTRLNDENFAMQADDRVKLQQFQTLLERNQLQAIDLVKIFEKMLKREHGIILTARDTAQSFPNGHVNTCPPYDTPGVAQRFQDLSKDISEMREFCREVGGVLEQTFSDFQRLRLCTGGNVHVIDTYDRSQITNAEEARMWQTIVNLRQSLIKNRRTLLDWHRERVFPRLKGLLSKIHHEIAEWQRAQAFAANGKYVESYDIDQLEDCCKPTAELMILSLDQIYNLTQLEVNTVDEERQFIEILERLRVSYENLIKEIVTFGLVVEKQPPQVLMKDKKFACHLRHLVSNGLGLHQYSFPTKVSLVTSDVACAIKDTGPTTPMSTSGEIVNNLKNSDYNEQTKQLHIHMTNMTLKMKMRGDKGRADTVAEEKYCMVFRSQIRVRLSSNTEYEVTAQTMSLPIVVISHGKQEADARATIFWDNAFSDAFRRPFEVPSQVQWSWILDGLHWLWKKECENESSVHMEGGGLSLSATKYLTHKLFNTESVEPSTMVTWKQFNHDSLHGKTFTFWKWFFNVMELVSSNFVKKYWNLGLIQGFVSKATSQKMLLQRSPGTFMFRFSDTVLGALSISCYTVCKDNPNRGYEVGHLQPDTVKKFQQRSLPDMVKDIQYLHFLYPATPKEHVFGPHYTPEPQPSTNDDDYWPKEMHVVLKGSHQQRQSPSQTISPNGDVLSPGVLSPGSVSEPFSPNVSRHESLDISMGNDTQP
uniref:STAT-a n=1 Tax=Phallusia mammillata TaxID=59560 RepID=A0A6F9DUF0_9ASCI|nr:STAT-a [Phallusia mammillata]